MKDRIVLGVDLVSSIDVAEREKSVQARLDELVIVGCCVRSQQIVLVHVKAVFLRSADVVLWREQAFAKETSIQFTSVT